MIININNIHEVTDKRTKALKDIERDRARATRVYNVKVKSKSFPVGELFCHLG
jgi:heme exporter protein D